MLPTIRLIHQIVNFFPRRAYDEDIAYAVRRLDEQLQSPVLTDRIFGNDHVQFPFDTPFAYRIAENELLRLVSIVNKARIAEGLGELLAGRERAKLLEQQRPMADHPWSFAIFSPLEPAGSTNVHDNDFADIQRISILPTMAEIMSKKQPSLPGNFQDVAQAHWLPPGPERLLDTHFRLLREDLMRPVRENIVGFCRYILDPRSQRNRGLTWRDGRLRGQMALGDDDADGSVIDQVQIDINVHRNARITAFATTRRREFGAVVTFSGPESLDRKSPQQRRQYWERSGRLENGMLVALVFRKDALPLQLSLHIVFGVVLEKSVERMTMNNDRVQITIMIPERFMDDELMRVVQSPQEVSTGYIIEANQVMFEGYRPVLNALQQLSAHPMDLPFRELICPSEPPARDAKGKMIVPSPIYGYAPDLALELSFLAGAGTDARITLNPTSRESQILAMQQLRQNTTLDEGQARALISSVSSSLACIQGPPGTGKSYVGVQIVRTLLMNKARTTPDNPIVLICFTNHALDQFVCHLLDAGINNIVRIGSRASEPRIEPLLLRNAVGKPPIPGRIATIYRELEQHQAKLRHLNALLLPGTLSWNTLAPYLKEYNPTQYGSFDEVVQELKDEKDDDFKTVGKHNKPEKRDILEMWIAGYNLEKRPAPASSLKEQLSQDLSEMEIGSDDEMEFSDIASDLEDMTVASDDADVSDMELVRMIGRRDSKLEFDRGIGSQHRQPQQPPKKSDRRASRQIPEPEPEPEPEPARSLEELQNETNVWYMTVEERNIMYHHWCTIVPRINMDQIRELQNKIEQLNMRLDDIHQDHQAAVLRKQQIVAATTTGAAKYHKLLQSIQAKIIVCEEAGEVLEAHTLASLNANLQQLILIGDHQQLRARVATHALSSESIEGQKYRLDVSLFERLQEPQMSFPLSTLDRQRRMRPDIADFVRKTLYPKLEDAEAVLHYPDVSGVRRNVFFFDHNNPEDQHGSATVKVHSHSNEFEARFSVEFLKFLLNQGYSPSDIVILTPYVGQLLKIRDMLSREMMIFISEKDVAQIKEVVDDDELLGDDQPTADAAQAAQALGAGANTGLFFGSRDGKMAVVAERVGLGKAVRVSTIDNFQGEEAKIVLISLVRNTAHRNETIGFLRTSNRINVLLSRAKEGMFVLGNQMLLRSKSKMWSQVLDIFLEKDSIGPHLPIFCRKHPQNTCVVSSPRGFEQFAPNGGCTQPCQAKLHDCGHICPLRCHPNNEEHRGIYCHEPCMRLHSPCNHPCPKRCGDICGDCQVKVDGVPHPRCGHTLPPIHCHVANDEQKLLNVVCIQMVSKTLLCGHSAVMPCSSDATRAACKAQCNDTLECGHKCSYKCGECVQFVRKRDSPDFDKTICAPESIKTQQSDMVLFSEYHEINLDEDPVIVLRCGHVFSISTLDGIVGMDTVYSTDAATGVRHLLPLPTDFAKLPTCPMCRARISRVRRYGRIINLSAVRLAERIWISEMSQTSADLSAKLAKVVNDCDTYGKETVANLNSRFAANAVKEAPVVLKKAKRRITANFADIRRHITPFRDMSGRSPNRKIYEASISFLTKFESNPTLFDMVNLSMPRPNWRFLRESVILLAQCLTAECRTITRFAIDLKETLGNIANGLDHHAMSCINSALAQLRKTMKNAPSTVNLGRKDLSACELDMTFFEAAAEHIRASYAFKKLKQEEGIKSARDLAAEWDKFKEMMPDSFRTKHQQRIDAFQGKLEEMKQTISLADVRMVVTVMLARFSAHGHWYSCPNGHPVSASLWFSDP
nr:hypothetical protein HK105_005699 [Polyrhizophydium stewartii]